MSRGLLDGASMTTRAVYSIGLAAIAGVVASLVDRVSLLQGRRGTP